MYNTDNNKPSDVSSFTKQNPPKVPQNSQSLLKSIYCEAQNSFRNDM